MTLPYWLLATAHAEKMGTSPLHSTINESEVADLTLTLPRYSNLDSVIRLSDEEMPPHQVQIMICIGFVDGPCLPQTYQQETGGGRSVALIWVLAF